MTILQIFLSIIGLLLLGTLIGAKLSEIHWENYNKTMLDICQIRKDMVANNETRINILEKMNYLNREIINEKNKKIMQLEKYITEKL